jgi:hypothetical protein
MESVYGRKRLAAIGRGHQTWMEHFERLEPEGGFRAAVQLAWSRTAPSRDGAGQLNSLNARVAMKAVYGRNGSSALAGHRETWMDRFARLEPAGGFRAAVERAWNGTASTYEEGLAA